MTPRPLPEADQLGSYLRGVAWLADYGAATDDPRERAAVVRVLREDVPRGLAAREAR